MQTAHDTICVINSLLHIHFNSAKVMIDILDLDLLALNNSYVSMMEDDGNN